MHYSVRGLKIRARFCGVGGVRGGEAQYTEAEICTCHGMVRGPYLAGKIKAKFPTVEEGPGI